MKLAKLLPPLLAGLMYVLGSWTIPHWWCGREAGRWMAGDPALQQSLARGVDHWVRQELGRADFSTGHKQFSGEWLFGTYLMAGLGFGQTALDHPEWRARHVESMSLCLERLLSAEVRAFDRERWGDDPLDTLDRDGHDHAAYLGYLNLLLGMHRRFEPASKYGGWNDRITAALVRRLERSPTLLLQSYPDEVYPVDNCAVIGSIALTDRATGADHSDLLRRWTRRCRERYVDPKTGLLIQCVERLTGGAADEPRGSGTALGLYFLSFADPALSRDLYAATRRELPGRILGFGLVHEYPKSATGGRGDIDSGPVILGYGISATGFSLAGNRMYRDDATFRQLYSTAYLFGAPTDRAGRRSFVMGGPLGNAILFAMLTARSPGETRP